VPASVANLGPGFDCLGVAVRRYLRIRIVQSNKPEIEGDAPPLPRNLTYQSFKAAYEAVQEEEAPSVRIQILESYPSARGMGASAAAIVAGLVAARVGGALALSDADLARLAIRLEGHADNVLPALFGGLVLASRTGWMRWKPSSDIAPLILASPGGLRTAEARQVLPVEVPRGDAVANAAATAALVAVLTGTQSPDALLMATEDRMHEPYRLPLIPESFELHEALRSKGIATALAGAGPSLISLVEAERLNEVQQLASDLCPEGWEVLTPGWDLQGAQVR
jgi:homoserine kinase